MNNWIKAPGVRTLALSLDSTSFSVIPQFSHRSSQSDMMAVGTPQLEDSRCW